VLTYVLERGKVAMWIVAFIILATVSGGTAAAFECAGVKLPSTIVICSDLELMRLADERQEAINEARGRLGEEQWPALWEDQKAWVRSYATACGVPPDRPPPIPVPASIRACFKRAAETRIAYIRAYNPTQDQPAAPSNARLDRIGPGFDCSKAAAPLAFMICGDPGLSQLDFRRALFRAAPLDPEHDPAPQIAVRKSVRRQRQDQPASFLQPFEPSAWSHVAEQWRKLSPSAELMVGPDCGARCAIRDTGAAGPARYHWTVTVFGETDPVAAGYTGELAEARSHAEGALYA
jgi:hypothetical protein